MAAPLDFDVTGARNAGFSDAAIADYLATKVGFDVSGARKAGFADADIIGHLVPPPKAAEAEPAPALENEQQGKSGTLGGIAKAVGQTLATTPGKLTSAGGALTESAGTAIQGMVKDAQAFTRRQLDVMDRIDAGQRVKPTDDPMGYADADPQQRQDMRAKLEADVAVMRPAKETGLGQVGESAKEVGREVSAAGGRATKWAEEAIPLTKEEQDRFSVRAAQTIAGFVPYLLAGAAGGVPGMVAYGGVEAFGRNYEEAKKAGASDEDAAGAAAISGLVQGGLNAVPMHKALTVMDRIPRAFKGEFVSVATETAKSSGTLLTFSQISTLADNVIARGNHDPNRPVTQGLGEHLGETALAGAFLPAGGAALKAAAKRILPAERTQPHSTQDVGRKVMDAGNVDDAINMAREVVDRAEQKDAYLREVFGSVDRATVERAEDGSYYFRNDEGQVGRLQVWDGTQREGTIAAALVDAQRDAYGKMGIDIIYYEGNQAVPDGVVLTSRHKDTIFLSSDPSRNAAQVAAHEVGHLVENTTVPGGPNLGAIFRQQVAEKANAEGWAHAENLFGETAPRREAYPEGPEGDRQHAAARKEHLTNELAAETLAELPKFREFLPDIIAGIEARYGFEAARSVVKQLITGIRQSMERLREFFFSDEGRAEAEYRLPPTEAQKWFNDFAALRDTAVKIYVERLATQAEKENAALVAMRDRANQERSRAAGERLDELTRTTDRVRTAPPLTAAGRVLQAPETIRVQGLEGQLPEGRASDRDLEQFAREVSPNSFRQLDAVDEKLKALEGRVAAIHREAEQIGLGDLADANTTARLRAIEEQLARPGLRRAERQRLEREQDIILETIEPELGRELAPTRREFFPEHADALKKIEEERAALMHERSQASAEAQRAIDFLRGKLDALNVGKLGEGQETSSRPAEAGPEPVKEPAPVEPLAIAAESPRVEGPQFSPRLRPRAWVEFARKVADATIGRLLPNTALTLGRTSEALRLAGAPDLPLVMLVRTVLKAARDKHVVPQAVLERLPDLLERPTAVFDSATERDALVALLDAKDRNGDPIIAAVHLAGDHIVVNRVASVYGKFRSTAWLKEQVLAGRLRYIDREKSRGLSATALSSGSAGAASGVQFPRGDSLRGDASPGSGRKIFTEADLVKATPDPSVGSNEASSRPASSAGEIIGGDDLSVVPINPSSKPQLSPRVTGENRARDYTPEQRQAFGNVGRTVEAVGLRRILADFRQDLGKKLVRETLDPYVGIRDRDPEGHAIPGTTGRPVDTLLPEPASASGDVVPFQPRTAETPLAPAEPLAIAVEGPRLEGPQFSSRVEPVARVAADEFAPETADIKVLREASLGFYRTALQARSIVSPDLGPISFAGRGLGDMKYASANPDKLRLVAALPDILRKGRLIKSEPERKGKANVVAYHTIAAPVQIGERMMNVEVVVEQRNDGKIYYSHFVGKDEASLRVASSPGTKTGTGQSGEAPGVTKPEGPVGDDPYIVPIDPSRKPQFSPRQYGIPADAPTITTFKSDEGIKAHRDYKAAKSGDRAAAARLVSGLVRPAQVETALAKFGPDTLYVPVVAEEATGHNAIPEFLARYYAEATGADVARGIRQTVRAFHTGADAMGRLIARPEFEGPVEHGRSYVIVDDVSVLGGTLAELANHIQAGGGRIAGVVTLVNASRSGQYAPRRGHLALIERRFGNEIREAFGVEPGALTADEVQYLVNFKDADALRARRANAESERERRLREKGVLPSETQAEVRARGVEPDDKPQFSPRQDRRAPGFYSALTRAVENLKVEEMVPDQWRRTIQNLQGVKAAELKWVGLDDWLVRRAKRPSNGKPSSEKPITKQEILDFLQAHEIQVLEIEKRGGSSTWNIGRFRLSGGKGYRELLLLMPERANDKPYKSDHWTENNVLAHVRFDQRTGSHGERILHLAEVQSDWHQEGRHQGYRWRTIGEIDRERAAVEAKFLRREPGLDMNNSSEIQSALSRSPDLWTRLLELQKERRKLPHSPFEKAWPELTMKRVIGYAAEHGYDRVTWETGATIVKRYHRRGKLGEIHHWSDVDGGIHTVAFDRRGFIILEPRVVEPPDRIAKLSRMYGRDLAERISREEGMDSEKYEGASVIPGDGRLIGGEDMFAFYDDMLPNVVRKLGRRFGAEVADSWIENRNGRRIPVHGIDITPEMRRSVMEDGFPLMSPRIDGRGRERARETVHSVAERVRLSEPAFDRRIRIVVSGSPPSDEPERNLADEQRRVRAMYLNALKRRAAQSLSVME